MGETLDKIRQFDAGSYVDFHLFEIQRKTLTTLKGIIEGMTLDGIVDGNEIQELKGWLDRNRLLLISPETEVLVARIESFIQDGIVTQEELEGLKKVSRTLELTENHSTNLVTNSIRELEGLFHGVVSDNEISDAEIQGLQDWVYNHEFLKGTYPYDELETLIISIKKDKVITDDERKMFKAFCGNFIDFNSSKLLSPQEYEEIRNKFTVFSVCATDPYIEVEGNTFCFTGLSKRATRATIRDTLVSLGGVFVDSVTRKLNYLVIGGDGNICWNYTTYGRKIEKAIELRKKGCHLTIVHERDFWDALEDL